MGTKPLICIVDDAADYRYILNYVFNKYLPQYVVRFFCSPGELLSQLPIISPDPALILLDYHMPVQSGYQTVLHLKQEPRYQAIPIVMMSADAIDAEIEACYQAGVNSFIKKRDNTGAIREVMSTLCQYWIEMNCRLQTNA